MFHIFQSNSLGSAPNHARNGVPSQHFGESMEEQPKEDRWDWVRRKLGRSAADERAKRSKSTPNLGPDSKGDKEEEKQRE